MNEEELPLNEELIRRQVVYVPRKFPRLITVLVVVSVTVNVLLALGGGFLALRYVTLAGRIHNSQVESCRQSNIARGRDIAIWNRLLAISPAQKASQTPAQLAEVKDLERLVAAKDTPVDCVALYSTEGRPAVSH